MSFTETVRNIFNTHPDIRVSQVGHTVHAERYVTRDGAPMAFEPRRIRFQNIYVRADTINPAALQDIEHQKFFVRNFKESKPNHNLFGEQAFRDGDLIRFRVTSTDQVKRIIDAVLRGR